MSELQSGRDKPVDLGREHCTTGRGPLCGRAGRASRETAGSQTCQSNELSIQSATQALQEATLTATQGVASLGCLAPFERGVVGPSHVHCKAASSPRAVLRPGRRPGLRRPRFPPQLRPLGGRKVRPRSRQGYCGDSCFASALMKGSQA